MNPSVWWNRTRYRLYAPLYDVVARPLRRGRERAIERLGPREGDRILLVGSGPGPDLEFLPAGTRVTAVDAVPGMVRRAADEARRLDRDIHGLVGDARELPFAADAFDRVLLHLILSVVPDPEAVAAETDRVLAPGGSVSIFDKFVPEGQDPSLLRRALNPLARVLFSELTRRLERILSDTALRAGPREGALGGLYTVTVARRGSEG